MNVTALTAEAADGGRILLTWQTPADPSFRGVRVLRRRGGFPVVADLGGPAEIFHDAVTPPGAAAQLLDGPLPGETVHYYTVVAYDAADGKFPTAVSALAPTPYDTGAALLRLLPEIYQVLDRDAGVLRRLTDLLAQPLDVVRTFTGAMRDLHDVARVDGSLLPLLAQWIGLPSDGTLSLEQQRNQIGYAPSYDRTTGTAANLRAAINHYVTWDARFKELVHNIFLVTHPEQLRLWEIRLRGGTQEGPKPVTFDVAYEGRPGTLLDRSGRTWILYHARRSAPVPAARAATGTSAAGVAAPADRFHLFAKIEDRGQMQPAVRLTFDDGVYKHPTAVQRPDGSLWLFHVGHDPVGGRLVPGIRLQLLAVGRPAAPAQATGTQAGPFTIADGDSFAATITDGAGSVHRRLVARAENIPGFPSASAADLAQVLDAELPSCAVTVTPDGTLQISTATAAAAASLTIDASPLATTLGLSPGVSLGGDATTATLTGARVEPFALNDGDTLTVRVDSAGAQTMTFSASEFADVAHATAAEVAAAIERRMPGVADAAGGALVLSSRINGAASVIAVFVDSSSAAPALGLGAPLPAPAAGGTDENEPSAIVDGANNIWLFWSSRRGGSWKIWHARSNGLTWEAPRVLTTGARPDREPFALFDAAAARLWVVWTRKQTNGLRDVMSRTTTNLDFTTLVDADWTERENTPAPTTFENREPAVALSSTAGALDLYFSSNRADGWNVWTRTLSVASMGAESAVTAGQETRRAAAPLRVGPDDVRIFLRANDAETYQSTLYPTATTLDGRYSGSTAIDLRNAAKIGLRGHLQDMQRYTYDTRPEPPDSVEDNNVGLYARQKVAVFLTPDTSDEELVLRERQLFVNALRRVLPIQVEAVFRVDLTYTDVVYGYDRTDAGAPLIGERMIDTILSEVIAPAADSVSDAAPAVRFIRTWVPGITGALPDLSTGNPPTNLPFRLFTKAFGEGT